jgi:hypothetical protein
VQWAGLVIVSIGLLVSLALMVYGFMVMPGP